MHMPAWVAAPHAQLVVAKGLYKHTPADTHRIVYARVGKPRYGCINMRRNE